MFNKKQFTRKCLKRLNLFLGYTKGANNKKFYYDTKNFNVISNEKVLHKEKSSLLENHKHEKGLLTNQQFLNLIFEPIYFSVDELKEIQMSNNPFTDEEIENIMDEELNKSNYENINCEVVEFCLDYLNRNDITNHGHSLTIM